MKTRKAIDDKTGFDVGEEFERFDQRLDVWLINRERKSSAAWWLKRGL